MAPLFVFVVGLFMWLMEHLRPRVALPRVAGWWTRTVLLNGLQVGSIFLFGRFIDGWLQSHTVFSLAEWPTPVAATLGYGVLTFFYYWWHRGRHENASLWRWVHQLHHSPARIEVWTSFYKHPLELVLNGLLSSAVMFVLLGLSPTQAALATAFSGLAELFYHWNIKTPHWLGYVIQRPEMHAVHHERGVHRSNYGDLPIWDMLFGTFDNPRTFDGACGFSDDKETRFGALLRGVDVHAPESQQRRMPWAAVAIAGIGLSAPVASILGIAPVQQAMGAALVSPAPRVFTIHNGVETFSQRYAFSYVSASGRVEHDVTRSDFEAMRGPYNRKNVFGGLLSHSAPYGRTPVFARLARPVARRALCGQHGLLTEIGLPAPASGTQITIRATPRHHADDGCAHGDHRAPPAPYVWEVSCPQ